MHNIGIVLDNVSTSQLAYTTIYNFNQYINNNIDLNPTIFYLNIDNNCIYPKFPFYNIMEICRFSGKIITTSLNTTIQSLMNVTSSKHFYVANLEWLRYKELTNIAADIFSNPIIQKIFRSESHLDKTKKHFTVTNVLDGFYPDIDTNLVKKIHE